VTLKKPKVLILGATGMLGSMVLDVFDRAGCFSLHATGREHEMIELGSVLFPKVSWHPLLLSPFESNVQRLIPLPEVEWIVNAIHITRPFISGESPNDRERALQINGIFPHELARFATSRNIKIIQFSTDWVFSGLTGNYSEKSSHDAIDVYGKTMSLGEVVLPHTFVIRTSLVGPEPVRSKYLLEWLLVQPLGAKISSFSNYLWNGITTLHLANICKAIIEHDLTPFGIHHLIPNGVSSEAETVLALAANFKRTDLDIIICSGHDSANRILVTEREALNERLWFLAGYREKIPTLNNMIKELANYPYRFRQFRNQ
jgi:dTDP-4-dehydrorhamnose reductase